MIGFVHPAKDVTQPYCSVNMYGLYLLPPLPFEVAICDLKHALHLEERASKFSLYWHPICMEHVSKLDSNQKGAYAFSTLLNSCNTLLV